jgi:glycerol-3-phosphate O-acyltransferase / dihydroxyacetone phosphate acyltransferase
LLAVSGPASRPFSPLLRLVARPLRALFVALVRFFYPRVRVLGAEHLPKRGPVLLVANHPNGLLDPVVLQVAVGQPVRFLAKSTFFRNPFGRVAMAAFDTIPVFRTQDAVGGDPQRRALNEETFSRCRKALREGAWLALFPEGTSHSDPSMRPLKTGAARIALSAVEEAAQAGTPIPLVIAPVGLGYEAKTIFRSGALVQIGPALPVTGAEGQRADALTAEIRARLADVVLEAETRDLLRGIAQVAAWTVAPGADPADPADRHERTRALIAAYREVHDKDPEAVQTITRAARDYARILGHLGVRDPWALEVEEVPVGRVALALGKLVLTAPVALVGALLGWLPYRLAGRVAKRVVGREFDILGTVKLLAGALFLLVGWSAEALAAGVLFGAPAALAVAALGPIGGYAALRFDEILADTVEGVRHLWLRRAHADKVARVVERRRKLADAVAEALAAASSSPAR